LLSSALSAISRETGSFEILGNTNRALTNIYPVSLVNPVIQTVIRVGVPIAHMSTLCKSVKHLIPKPSLVTAKRITVVDCEYLELDNRVGK
jgi:hypothetical protein